MSTTGYVSDLQGRSLYSFSANQFIREKNQNRLGQGALVIVLAYHITDEKAHLGNKFNGRFI